MGSIDYTKLQSGTDVRGIALDSPNKKANLTDDAARTIGAAIAKWVASHCGNATPSIAIGRDCRLTGPSLVQAVSEGLCGAGAKIVDCGMATTPAMFMSLVFDTSINASIMITASHLPKEWNGIKIFTKDGALEGKDVHEILAAANEIGSVSKSKVEGKKWALLAQYKDYLLGIIIKALGESAPLKGLHVTIDAGNGMAGFFVDILHTLGCDTIGSQFLDPDGSFPNHIPNPEDFDAMEAIKESTVNSGADLGFIFDTDVDRMSCVFSDGTGVNRDAIIALVAAILVKEGNSGFTVVTDSVTSRRLSRFLKSLGLKHLCYMRGYKNIIDKQKELVAKGVSCPLAMETSGHGALSENYFLDDGAFLAVKILVALAKCRQQSENLPSLIKGLEPLISERVYRLKILLDKIPAMYGDFREYEKMVLEEFKIAAINAGYTIAQSYEGVRLEFDGEMRGWVLLRASLHEAVMPLNIESELPRGINKMVEAVRSLLNNFTALDLGAME